LLQIDVSLESLGPKCIRSYLPASYGLSTSNKIRMSFALSNHLESSPLIHLASSEGRHITLELYKRRVRLVWNLGGTTATVTHPMVVHTRDPKYDDAWYHVEANRTLNLGSLVVRRMNNYGELTPPNPVTITGSTDTEHTRFYQSRSDRISLGGFASKDLQFTPGLNVVVHQVEVDNAQTDAQVQCVEGQAASPGAAGGGHQVHDLRFRTAHQQHIRTAAGSFRWFSTSSSEG